MNPEEIKQTIHAIELKLGLKPQAVHALMWEAVLKERMARHHFSTLENYFTYLFNSRQEWQELMERLVIPETWFFRNQVIFHFLADWAIQIKQQTSFLKILSLACSTGEEPYSIAMTLFEANLSRNTFQIDALDISQKALDQAKKGIYYKKSFREKESRDCRHYFDASGMGFKIKEKVKEKVDFYQGDILDEHTTMPHQSYHLIFCCNLLIYLNHEAQMHVLNRIKTWLAPEGILIVSSAESSIARRAGFVLAKAPYIPAFHLGQIPPQLSQPTIYLSQNLKLQPKIPFIARSLLFKN